MIQKMYYSHVTLTIILNLDASYDENLFSCYK